MQTYQSLIVSIRPHHTRNYEVRISGFAGEAKGTLVISPELESLLQLRNNAPSGRVSSEIGTLLFESLFHDRELFGLYQRATADRDTRIRFVLAIDPAAHQIMALPWEEMYDSKRRMHLALGNFTLIRYVASQHRTLQSLHNTRLRVLLTSAHTPPAASIEREFETIKSILEQYPADVDLICEPHLSYQRFLDLFRSNQFDLWHFVGHGKLDIHERYEFVFEDTNGEAHPVLADRVVGSLVGGGLKFAILHSCSGARIFRDPLHAAAPLLAERCVEACVAMQAPIDVDVSLRFADGFYHSLVERNPIDQCVADGRKSILSIVGSDDSAWSVPVIYSRTEHLTGISSAIHDAKPPPRNSQGPLIRLLGVGEDGQPITSDELERIGIAQLLAEQGDTRTKYDSASYWVTVDAGPFLYGSLPADEAAERHEKPQILVDLPTFQIARYPITNAQWQEFIDDRGYENREWWTRAGMRLSRELAWQRPAFMDHQQLNGANQPVVGVSWYEASAFTLWLSARLGKRIDLPTEQEWEKAARGSDGRAYPWGNDVDRSRANTGGSRRSFRTAPVGIYPHGQSPYGILDMAGNVAEWTKSVPQVRAARAQGSPGSDELSYIVRGGSWRYNIKSARCAYRQSRIAHDRQDWIGLRVCIRM